MRRLSAVASMFSAALLVSTLLSPASAQPRDPDELPKVSAAQARDALQAARDLFAGKARSSRASKRQSLQQGREATLVLRDLWRAEPSLSGADRRTAQGFLARPSDFGGDRITSDFTFALSPSTKKVYCNTYFCVHYTESGQHATTPDYAKTVASALTYTRSQLVDKMGFRAPIRDTAASYTTSNPNAKFDVFLGNIGQRGLYGYCTLDSGRPTSYCALDNDFREFPGAPINSLKVTAAHEFFHAIQFAYDAGEDAWFMEGSSVWAEERVFDGINDYLQYVRGDSAITNPSIPVDQDSVYNYRVYASMLFFEHLTQTLGVVRMRQIWETAVGTPYSLQAIKNVVSRVTNWNTFISRFAVWNSRPPGVGYAERGYFPGGRYTVNRALGLRTTRGVTSRVRRDHLASAAFLVRPATASTRTQRVRITINGPSTGRGAVAAVQRRLPNGRTSWNHVALNRYGDATFVQPFGRGRIKSVVITIANASTSMTRCGTNAPTVYSCNGYGRYSDYWTVSARVIK